MQRLLWFVSVVTLVVLAAGIIGQVLTVAFNVYYTSNGDVADPTPLAVLATVLDLGGLLAMPLSGVALILGLTVAAQDRHYGWLAAMVGATLLACVGLLVMAWMILSVRSSIAFQTPLALIPLVIAFYSRKHLSRSAIAIHP